MNLSVGYLYDPTFLEHDAGYAHPEQPARLQAILGRLEASGILAQLQALPVVEASDEDLERVHDVSLLRRLAQLHASGGGRLGPDTRMGPRSYIAARMAAGSAIGAARAIWESEIQSGFALTRPPGHHAEPARAMGFCLLNNVALAAHWLLAQGAKRLAIVDFDAHHGNGTAAIFAGEPRVLYASLHQHPWYPTTGDWREMGHGEGYGTELNIPLPAESGDRNLQQVTERVIMPALERFAPEVLLISAGYDGHWADPLTWLLFSLEGLQRLVQRLAAAADALCQGRMLLVLEGGYDLEALSHGVAGSMAALLGQELPDPLGSADEPEPPIDTLLEALEAHHPLCRPSA